MIERDGYYWIPILPKDMRQQMEKLPDDRKDWPADFKAEYDRLRADFTRSKAEFISWFRKDRDSRMNKTCKLVLAFLVDCLNFETGRCDPSQQLIADELFIGLSTVERCISRIGGSEWMEITRRGKTTTNFYRFRVSKAKVNALLDTTTELRELRAEERANRRKYNPYASDPSEVRDHPSGDPSEMKAHDPAKVRDHDPSEMRAKHKNRTLEDEPLNESSCSDGREDTYPHARARREEIPDREEDFGPWIRGNIPDPTRHREALRLLRAREMTPEILRRLAA